MSKKIESSENTNTSKAEYSYNTNNQNNNNTNTNDFKESVNRSLDEAKDNIRKSIDESKNQIPRINNIVNSYQEQSLQTAKEISEEYIDSQKEIINSLQSAWTSYSESFNGLVNNWSASPESSYQSICKICQQCCRQHSVSNKTHKQHHILKHGLMENSDATGKGQLKTPVKHGRKHSKNI